MNDQPIKFIEGPPPSRIRPDTNTKAVGRVGAIRTQLRTHPGVWAEVAREPLDNRRNAYAITARLIAGRVGAGYEAVTRTEGSTVAVYARFVA